MIKLTDTQRTILTTAAHHPEGMAYPPTRLPTGARQSVANALLRQGLVIAASHVTQETAAVWTVDGGGVILQITKEGLVALAPNQVAGSFAGRDDATGARIAANGPVGPQGGETIASAAYPALSLRRACTAFLEAWDACPAQDTTDSPIGHALNAMRTALHDRHHRASGSLGTPRQGTKQEAVLALLRRSEGATIAQIMEVTGWQQHTVRGFFAGLKKRQSINVEVLERVRQVGPGAQGSRGSHSVYAVAAGA